MSQEVHGQCLCGKVKVKADGPPMVSGYCHCETCRRWHAAPINTWSLWQDASVTVTEGEELLQGWQLTEMSHRHWCKNCGTGVINKAQGGFTIIYSQMFAGTDFAPEPAMHVQYAERVLDINDGLPKFKDFPADFGGSGEMIE